MDLLLDDSVYYKKRLLDVGIRRLGAFQNSKSRYILEKNITIREDQITEISDSKFIVTSEKDAQVCYQVDMISGLCDCQAGLNRGTCKHKDAIAKYFNIAEFSVLPVREAFQSKTRGNLGNGPNGGGGRQKIKKVPTFSWETFKIKKVPTSRGYQRPIK